MLDASQGGYVVLALKQPTDVSRFRTSAKAYQESVLRCQACVMCALTRLQGCQP
jgi:hypothetical protein